ncbi:uncharacterized protein KIAA0408 homolog [Antechinus flavipes]|uniref:uncharacterized protein KIAA0408 homolog n=1 Tax=Antechinus flavipes TaxID=38775 RepID=UPI00223690D4|nr:uncharacterized protein KIAA0408 homolog [Antechinus flavipes]
MDLQKQWETKDTNWIKERMELLDQFDNERKEWESQWKVMQKKIEELCQEVKLRRESKKNDCSKTVEHNKNVQSKIAPFRPHSSNSGQCDTAVLNDGFYPVSPNPDSMKGGSFLEENISVNKSKMVFMDPLTTGNQKKCDGASDLKISEAEKRSCTHALNTALEELAKVSEELCNFQEEIQKRSNPRRMKSAPFLQETVNLDVNHMVSNGPPTTQIGFDIEKQINRKKPIHFDNIAHDTPIKNSLVDTLFLQRNETPPIPPPRSTSRNLPSSYSRDFLVFDGPKENLDKWETQDCSSKRNYSNNFPEKPHEATVSSPYEQNTLKNQIPFATSVEIAKTDSETQCNKDLVTNIWPHEISNLGTSVKSMPSILWFPKTCLNSDKLPYEKLIQSHQANSGAAFHERDDLNSSLKPNSDSFTGAGCNFEKISKNEKLAAKTDEFNRTVFRTDRCCSSVQHNQRLSNSSKDSKPCDPLCTCAVQAKENDNLCCAQNSLSVLKERMSNSFTKKVMGGQAKQAQEHLNTSNYHHMLHEHNWRPSNLLGRPRSADPKSNYGVVEKLLRNYENSTGSLSQNSKSFQDQWTKLDCNVINSDNETFSQCLEMFPPEQEKQELQMKSVMSMEQQSKEGIERKNLTKESVAMKSTDGKGFSRPTRPANRRPPSRWAPRSPSAPLALKKTVYDYSFSLQSETSVV